MVKVTEARCPNGWFRYGQSCYLFVYERYNWFQSWVRPVNYLHTWVSFDERRVARI